MSTGHQGSPPIRFAAVGLDHAHTETACPQRHTFEAMRLAIAARQSATMTGFAQ